MTPSDKTRVIVMKWGKQGRRVAAASEFLHGGNYALERLLCSRAEADGHATSSICLSTTDI